MRPGDHDKPERLIREPWWRAAFWEFLLRAGATVGLVAGVVGDFYVCRWIGRDLESYPPKAVIAFCVILVTITMAAGYGIAYAIVRLLRGSSGQEPPESSSETGSSCDSPPE